jgi:Brp/Blh family beta-carotene 15,15'-monooxygenase
VQYAPFALSLVLFGLPHGAVDHLVPGRLSGRETPLTSMLGVALLYAALAALYLGLWAAAPVAAFGLFISLTWFHWGQGDLYSLRALAGAEHLAPPLRALTVFVRGGLPMLVPLLAFPEVYRSVARSLVAVFGDQEPLDWLTAPAFRLSAGAVFFALVLVAVVWGYWCSGTEGRGAWRIDTLEVASLAAYFVVVPPVFALGLYFCFWHATRHIARLMLLNQTSAAALEKGDLPRALGVFFRDAAPLTGVALTLLAGLYLLAPGRAAGPEGLLAVYLVLISVLTLPHVVIVGLMDHQQGIWR